MCKFYYELKKKIQVGRGLRYLMKQEGWTRKQALDWLDKKLEEQYKEIFPDG